jgi:beta-xylosidase
MRTPPPLVTHIYTADPRAHVWQGRIYVYPSHDVDSESPGSEDGDQFAMEDYHVLSMDRVGGEVIDHGVALHIRDVPWASRQMWSNDVARKNGQYYMYFPAKDHEGIFRIGAAVSDRPEGPFLAEETPLAGSFSIDPSAFEDEDGAVYLVFGGIWGGQLQRWQSGTYDPNVPPEPTGDAPAIGPRMARLNDDMLHFGEAPREIQILDKSGAPLRADDHERRFFEAPWIHKYRGRYYLSYSTGDTHLIVYAVGDNPYGPFTYQGIVLTPVMGWTTHHSIVQFEGKWYLFYHDCALSGGQTHLRSVKVAELQYRLDGSIVTIAGQ